MTAPILVFEPLGRGGIADYTEALVRALSATGQEVVLITAADGAYEAAANVEIVPTIRWLRPTSRWRRAVRAAHLGPVFNAARFVVAIPSMVRRARRCSLVHIEGFYFPPLLALLVVLLHLARVPVVHTPHNVFDRGHSHDIARRLLARFSDAQIVHAEADLPFVPDSSRRTVVIPHGEYGGLAKRGGSADRASARRELGIGAGAIVALLFGQLRQDKGIEDLLAAAADVPEVTVLLAGEDLGGLARADGLLSDPALKGRVIVRPWFHELDSTAQVFAAADLVALPYRRASQSGVLLLAYGFSRPVAVYPVGGLPEAVVDGETGWVCPESTPEALTAALREAADRGEEECLRRGVAGRRLAETRFSWEAIASRTLTLYGQVLGD